jgi:nitroreductase
MNAIIEAILTRRSIRKYRDKPVSRELLETIVDCGRLAPSSKNVQPWEFIVVTERAMLRKLAGLATSGKFIAEASACIVVCGDPKSTSVYLDGAAATENMLLAIHALGLASCWVQGYDKPYSEPAKELLNIPCPFVLISLVPVAYPAQSAVMPKKRPIEQVLHWEIF